MDLFSAGCTAVSIITHGLFIFGLMKIASHSFKPYRNYLILYSSCMSVYSVTIALCDISMASSTKAVVMMSQGLVRGGIGLGIYLATMSINMVVLITLPIYRYSAIKRNWLYLQISSSHAIAPYCALTALAGLLIYWYYRLLFFPSTPLLVPFLPQKATTHISLYLPAYFFKPDPVSVEVAAPLLKQKFGLSRDYGYMAMIGYYGDNMKSRWKAYVGLAITCLFILSFYIIAIIMTLKIRKEALGRNRSKKRQFLEKRHLICFWSQTALITVLDQLPRIVWGILPLLSIASDVPDEFSKYSNPFLPILSALSIIYTVPELYIHIMKARGKPVAPSMDAGTATTDM